jgi:hypothetical protein
VALNETYVSIKAVGASVPDDVIEANNADELMI